MSAPYLLASAMARGTPLRVTRRTMEAALDWLNAEDAARARSRRPGPVRPIGLLSGS